MTHKWSTIRIEDAAKKLAMGPFGSDIKTNNFVSIGVPVIRGSNLTGERFQDTDFVYLTDAKADELKAANAFPEDIIFTHRGTLGQVAIIPQHANYERYVVSQSQMKLTCDTSKVEPSFVFYFFRSPQGQHALLANTSTTGVPAISRPLTSLKQIRIPYPPLPEQRAIARVLGSLDDKIELNRNMNATLEDLARTLFKSWFIDFDPVHAKAAGRAPTGMDAATAALFPDSFENVQGRMVPQGWVLDSLTKFVEVNPQRQLANLTKAPYLDMKNMPTQGHRPDKWVYRDFGSGMRFRNGDTLVARITPCLENGKTAYVDFLKEQEVGWGSTEYLVLHPIPPLPPEFVYYLARNENFRAFVISNMTGSSGRQRVSANSLSHFQTIVPSRNIAIVFGDMAHKLMTQVRANSKQSYTLITLRDLLLPKLISGEVRVRDAERFVEEQL